MKSFLSVCAILASSCLVPASASAKDLTVDIHNVSGKGVGAKIGTVVISEGEKGLKLKVDIAGVPPGEHGFHLHETGDCSPAVKDSKELAALAAGPHYDPSATKSHDGPQGSGHKGDLPFLISTDKGVNVDVMAPNLTLADVEGRALVIHEAGDNYTNQPENGGGKGRIACGVVPKG